MGLTRYSTSTSETGAPYTVEDHTPLIGSDYKWYGSNAGRGYLFKAYPDGTFAMPDASGEYNVVTDPEQIAYLLNRAKILEKNNQKQGWNWLGYVMPNRLLNTKFGNWLGHFEEGGTLNMNYSQYMQAGGAANLKAAIMQQVKQAMALDKPGTVKKLLEMGLEGQLILQELAQEDPEVAQIAEELMTQTMKCGGKVRAKVRKHACGGKSKKPAKKEEGGEVVEAKCGGKAKKKVKKAEAGAPVTISNEKKSITFGAKGTCIPCQKKLMRVGGKIVETGCDGMPIRKEGGMINKFSGGGINSYGGGNVETMPGYLKPKGNPAIGNWIRRLYNSFLMSQEYNRLIHKGLNNLTPTESDYRGADEEMYKKYGDAWDRKFKETGLLDEQLVNKLNSDSRQGIDIINQALPVQIQEELPAVAETPSIVIGSQKWESGLSPEQKENLRKLRILKEAGYKLRGKNGGLDADWGTSSDTAWKDYEAKLALKEAAELAQLKQQNEGLTTVTPVYNIPQRIEIPISNPVLTVDNNREAAIAAMSGRHISNRERERYGAAYDAIKYGVNPTELSKIQMADIQRMGKVYGPQYRAQQLAAKSPMNDPAVQAANLQALAYGNAAQGEFNFRNGGSISYAQYLK